MRRRLKRAVHLAALRPGRVLRDALRDGYTRRDLRADLMAGAMVVAVSVGVVLAALLFMERMADTSSSDLISEGHPDFETTLPRNIVIYEVAGPLFFSAAQKAMSTLRTLRKNVKVVVLDLRAVPIMDAMGLVNLESAIGRLQEAGIMVILGGIRRQPHEVMERAGWTDVSGRIAVCASYTEAIALARRRLAEMEEASAEAPPAPVAQ